MELTSELLGTWEVVPTEKLLPGFLYEHLVFDPGQMVGWAGVRCAGVYENSWRVGERRWIEVGQGPWHEARSFRADSVTIERTPFGARRTHDLWPAYFTGFVLAKIYPDEPGWVLPTNLKVAQKWYELPRRHGLGPHAKDALTHLVHVLVTKDETTKTGAAK